MGARESQKKLNKAQKKADEGKTEKLDSLEQDFKWVRCICEGMEVFPTVSDNFSRSWSKGPVLMRKRIGRLCWNKAMLLYNKNRHDSVQI